VSISSRRRPALIKDIQTPADFRNAVKRVIGMYGTAFVETDMRAHRNPTRMRAIKRATLDLVRRFRSPCPVCAAPGFAVTERPRRTALFMVRRTDVGDQG
jgi:hypothetical protein